MLTRFYRHIKNLVGEIDFEFHAVSLQCVSKIGDFAR